MKLKKTASLALAGLMAVGMLAGCSNAAEEPEQPTVPEGTAAVSAEVGARVAATLGHAVPSYVTFANDNGLTEDLKYAVEYSGVRNSLFNYVYTTAVTEVTTANDIVLSTLKDEAGVTQTGDPATDHTLASIGASATLLADEAGQGKTMPNAKAVSLYVVSGEIGENAINQMVAEKIADIVDDYVYSVSANGQDQQSSIFNHEYTVSVSTCSKTVNDAWMGTVGQSGTGAADPTVVFVAVQVVRTSTHHS